LCLVTDRILRFNDLTMLADGHRQQGQRIAFVCGTFDLLHAGHLSTLRTARWHSGIVVVGVFDDATTRLVRGPGRPVQAEQDRLEIVASLVDVDYVVMLSHGDAAQAVSLLRPDVYVTAADAGDLRPEIEQLRACGGEVVFAPLVPGRSTEGLVAAIASAVDSPPVGHQVSDGGPDADYNDEPVARFTFVDGRDSRSPVSREFTFYGASSDDLILGSLQEWKTFYEADVLRYFVHMVRPGGLIVDVGANIGNPAVFFAAYMAELVIAIEPAPELAVLLKRNLEVNAVENAIVVEAAAGAREDEGYVVRPKGSVANAGATQVRPILNQTSPAGADLVPITTVDAVIDGHAAEICGRRVSLLKVDVEGSELAVLSGAHQLLEEDRPHVLVEITLNVMFTAIAEFLRKRGYVPFARLGGLIPMYYFMPADQVPVLGNRMLRHT
jgi:rfaE bifunctional protein nucleotidyltransferase chain/domain